MRRQDRVFWCFFTGWALIFVLNTYFGAPSCWFYSDARGEYSLSENLSAASYLASAILLCLAYRKYGRRLLLAAAAFSTWLMLEETNYGQIFFQRSATNFYYDADQFSLHSAILRPIKLGFFGLSLNDVAAFCVRVTILAIVPLVLKRHFKVKGPLIYFVLPLGLMIAARSGQHVEFFALAQCGSDSFNELVETVQATAAAYFTCLLLLHLKEKSATAAAR